MKKIPALIVLLVTSALATLPALDIYVNNVLWRSYTGEALDALITEIPAEAPPSLPFALLLPLMEETGGMHLLFKGGDARLECGSLALREARLVRHNGKWELNWDGSSYRDPRRADLYGRRIERKELMIWAEPGLANFEKQIRVWSSLHKLELRYLEIEDMENELIHRRLTGEEQPDFVLRFQSSGELFSEEKNAAYLLRSVLDTGASSRRLTLPQGERFHPELFLSLLLSLEEPRDNPFQFRFSADDRTLNRGRDIYLRLIQNQKLREKNSLYGGSGTLYYPARRFPLIPGTLTAIPTPDGGGILPPRILPLQLKCTGNDFPEAPLLDFLRLPGTQHSLLSLPERQLPALEGIMEEKRLSPEEEALYSEWKSGYILSSENSLFFNKLKEIFPDLYRNDGVLP